MTINNLSNKIPETKQNTKHLQNDAHNFKMWWK